MAKKQRVYVRKSKPGRPADVSEYVVRIELPCADYAICGCDGRFEADFVKQCIAEAMGAKSKSVRLERLIAELNEAF